MFTLAVIIYVVVAIIARDPLWILDMFFGKAGLLGVLLAIGWCILFFFRIKLISCYK